MTTLKEQQMKEMQDILREWFKIVYSGGKPKRIFGTFSLPWPLNLAAEIFPVYNPNIEAAKRKSVWAIPFLNKSYGLIYLYNLSVWIERAIPIWFKERNAKIIFRRFRDGKTYEAIAQELSVSNVRIQQIIEIACRKIRHPARLGVLKNLIVIGDRCRGISDMYLEYEAYERDHKVIEEPEKTLDLETVNKDNISDVDNIPIENLELSTRAFTALKRCGINTVGDFRNNIEIKEDLMAIRGIGTKCIKEIIEKISKYIEID